MFKPNFILNSDSYKMSHFLFYPEGTTNVYSYMESRGGKYDATLFFGLQGFIKQYLLDPITKEDIEYAQDFAIAHGVPFNKDGWNHILNKHGGFIPVEIKAVPEGTMVPTRNVLLTVENTDPAVPFITSYIETMALRLWYPITVATRGYHMKDTIRKYFEMTSDTMDLSFALLDFSARGCSSYETNQIGGAAHLVNFLGSDSMAAIDYVKQFYGGQVQGYSVPATEHSIMCAYGQNNELDSFERILAAAPAGGILSVVSDTWNIYEAVEKWITLKDKVAEKGITLVIRPDSGDIDHVLRKLLPRIREGFGAVENSRGFDVLNNVKVLWGDGMDEHTIYTPFDVAYSCGIAADSVMAGSGGGLMQADIDRDTCKFAFKASNITIAGKDIPIAKDPITDPGKMSKKGRMVLSTFVDVDTNKWTYGTVTSSDRFYDQVQEVDILEPVYRNGELLKEDTMDEIRKRIV